MAADRGAGGGNYLAGGAEGSEKAASIANFKLIYMAHEGNAEGIRELLDAGAHPNFRDLDGRTAMHIPACEEHAVAVQLLFEPGAGCWSESWFFCCSL
nr:integrin-linked protein kinase 1-like isoform X2 [Lolium perenne]